MYTTTKRLSEIKIIPMIKNVALKDIDELVHALTFGGIEALNFSQQSSDGLELLRYTNAHYPAFICGGGNVQTSGEARNAIEAGAKFILSPLFDPLMVELCQDNGIPIYPVITDGVVATEYGLETIALYPVEKHGGKETVDKLYDQFGIHSIVAGSITDETVKMYTSHKGVIAVTGSWMITQENLEQRFFDKIAIACQKTLLVIEE